MKYRALIVIATVIWGSSFVVCKDAVTFIDPSWLLAVRFITSAFLLGAISWRNRELFFKKEYVCIGLLFGAALFSGYYFQTVGVQYTTPGKNAFLTGVYCVIVPFLAWFFTKKAPTAYNLAAALTCIVGVGLVSLGSVSGLNKGDFLSLICAVFFAIHICLVSKFTKGRNVFVLTMWQFFGVGIFSVLAALLTGAPISQLAGLNTSQWATIGYLTLFCTTIALLFQNISQSKLPPTSASLLLSLESPFGVAFSVALGYELLTIKMLFGFVLIFAAILISEWLPDFLQKRRSQQSAS